MRWGRVIKLIASEFKKDAITGEQRPREIPREVRANPWKVSFDQRVVAGTYDFRGALRFEIQRVMYRGEKFAEVDGERYHVAAEIRGHRAILTLTEVAND